MSRYNSETMQERLHSSYNGQLTRNLM